MGISRDKVDFLWKLYGCEDLAMRLKRYFKSSAL